MTSPQDTPLVRGGRGRLRAETLRDLVQVADTPLGRGVFARRKLVAGRVLGEIVGDVLAVEPEDPSYCMELPSGRVLEPAAPLRFLNHSCEPNCEIQNWVVGRERRIGVFASRAVRAGDELTIDYQYARRSGKGAVQQICYCGAAACQGFIGWKQTHAEKGGSGSASSPSRGRAASASASSQPAFVEDACYTCQGGGTMMQCSGRFGGVPCAKVRARMSAL